MPLVARLLQIMYDSRSSNLLALRLQEKVKERNPKTLADVKLQYFNAYTYLHKAMTEIFDQHPQHREGQKRNRDKADSTAAPLCTNCGRAHDERTCLLRTHPDFNKESVA